MLPEVLHRIEAACARVGRDPSGVTLVAITKGHDVAEIRRRILAHGHRVLGENRVQEWQQKFAGVELIHSLDSERLADALEAEGAKRGMTFRTLLQVNVAAEASKYGAAPTDAAELARHVTSLPHVTLEGLMTMAPYSDDPEDARPHFRELRRLGDTLALPGLSMGMSGDFEVAVEEGATWVRVGSALFR
ncbi:MAG: YggS family pyridoxal phosphate enzyme [Deinococcales bacterium]